MGQEIQKYLGLSRWYDTTTNKKKNMVDWNIWNTLAHTELDMDINSPVLPARRFTRISLGQIC